MGEEKKISILPSSRYHKPLPFFITLFSLSLTTFFRTWKESSYLKKKDSVIHIDTRHQKDGSKTEAS